MIAKKDYSGLKLILIVLITIFSVGYIMFWCGIISTIMTISNAIDNKTLTASLAGHEFIKFLLKEILGGLVIYLGIFIFLFKVNK